MTRRRSAERGHTLAELIIAMTVLGVVGAGITRLIVVQSKAFQKQDMAKQSRAVNRAALNVMQSEVRLVEATGGVSAASALSITVRVPYAMGVICTNTGTTTISILPVDSMMYAQATFAGYAWRDSATSAYTYVTASPTVAAGTTANCTGAGFTTLTGGRVLNITPTLTATARPGENVFLFQNVTYSFAQSTMLPGRTGLYRQVGTGTNEELAAPFDSANTRFRFFNLNIDTSQTVVPTLANIRGIDVQMAGQSERVPPNASTYQTTRVTTGIFFGNRVN